MHVFAFACKARDAKRLLLLRVASNGTLHMPLTAVPEELGATLMQAATRGLIARSNARLLKDAVQQIQQAARGRLARQRDNMYRRAESMASSELSYCMAAKEAVDDEDVYKIRPNYMGNLRPPSSPTKAYLLRGARQSPSASRPSSAKGSSSGGSISSAGCGSSWTRVYREQQARRWLIKQQRAKQQHADGRVWAMAGAGGEGCGESYNTPAMRGGALSRPHLAPTAQAGSHCASQEQQQRFAIVEDADHMPFDAVQMPPRYYSQIDSTRRTPPRVARCLQCPSSQAQIGGELSVRPVGGGMAAGPSSASSAAGGAAVGAICCHELSSPTTTTHHPHPHSHPHPGAISPNPQPLNPQPLSPGHQEGGDAQQAARRRADFEPRPRRRWHR